MIVIDDILISEALQEPFCCDVEACKGGCCVDGDGGAPLDKEELAVLDEIYEKVKPFITEQGRKTITEQGKYVEEKKDYFATPLINGGACAYVFFNEKGIAKCGIEKAYEEGLINFKKPVSCHLYPVRIKKKPGFEAINYEHWDICNPACKLGKKLGLPLYKFLKEAIIRKYGEEFYNVLEQAFVYAEQSESDKKANL